MLLISLGSIRVFEMVQSSVNPREYIHDLLQINSKMTVELIWWLFKQNTSQIISDIINELETIGNEEVLLLFLH